MKKYIILFVFAMNIVFAFGQGYPSGDYELTSWSDEFNSTTKDNTKWQNYKPDWIDFNNPFFAEKTIFDPSNVTFGQNPSQFIGNNNYVCKIITQYIFPSSRCAQAEGGIGCSHVISGQIYHKKLFKYGYFEVKMKEPNVSVPICSAVWLWGGNDEIDFQENTSNSDLGLEKVYPSKNIIRNAIYYCESSGCPWPFHSDIPYKDANNNLLDITQSFHIYGLDWQPEYIDFYFDNKRISHVPNKQDMTINNFNPMAFVIWAKAGDLTYNPPAGQNTLEVDYFRYYKRKPLLRSAVYNSSNTVTLTVNTGNSEDTYNWVPGSYISINGSANTNVANIALNSAYNGTSVTVYATGKNPPATSSMTFTFQQNSNNICGNLTQNYVYLGTNINAPQAGCSSTVVKSGKNVTFIASSTINLNAGFEVELGATYNALTQ